MLKENLLAKKSEVQCLGCEIGVLEEFDDLVNLLASEEFDIEFVFLTSNIKYSETIENIITNKKSHMVISLDSGCEETYKKIKRVPYFNQVVDNIKKYISMTKKNNPNIILKYIIVEKLNDNKEEIEKFLTLISEIGIKRVRLDVEYLSFIDKLKDQIPLHYYELFHYAKKRTVELGLELDSYKYENELLTEYKPIELITKD